MSCLSYGIKSCIIIFRALDVSPFFPLQSESQKQMLFASGSNVLSLLYIQPLSLPYPGDRLSLTFITEDKIHMEAPASVLPLPTFSSPIPYPKSDIPVHEAKFQPYSPATILWPPFHW